MNRRDKCKIRWTLFGGVSLLMLFPLLGCGDRARNTPNPIAPREAVVPVVVAPSRPILFQPMFNWLDSEPSYQGTGFFAKAPNGKIAAVTSAHFLDRDGPLLLEAKWLDIRTRKPIATFTTSWGLPGNAGTTMPIVDLRPDYLLLPAPDGIDADLALDLDPREILSRDERVWFPNNDPAAATGYQLISGTVSEASANYTVITLDERVVLRSQSGSPVISQASGKVVGTVSRGSLDPTGTNILFLAPSHAIVRALAQADEFPRLREVVGKKVTGTKTKGE